MFQRATLCLMSFLLLSGYKLAPTWANPSQSEPLQTKITGIAGKPFLEVLSEVSRQSGLRVLAKPVRTEWQCPKEWEGLSLSFILGRLASEQGLRSTLKGGALALAEPVSDPGRAGRYPPGRRGSWEALADLFECLAGEELESLLKGEPLLVEELPAAQRERVIQVLLSGFHLSEKMVRFQGPGRATVLSLYFSPSIVVYRRNGEAIGPLRLLLDASYTPLPGLEKGEHQALWTQGGITYSLLQVESHLEPTPTPKPEPAIKALVEEGLHTANEIVEKISNVSGKSVVVDQKVGPIQVWTSGGEWEIHSLLDALEFVLDLHRREVGEVCFLAVSARGNPREVEGKTAERIARLLGNKRPDVTAEWTARNIPFDISEFEIAANQQVNYGDLNPEQRQFIARECGWYKADLDGRVNWTVLPSGQGGAVRVQRDAAEDIPPMELSDRDRVALRGGFLLSVVLYLQVYSPQEGGGVESQRYEPTSEGVRFWIE